MKGFLCACLLVSLQSMSVARAYEADIHYSATYAIARAAGWAAADALTIASANQGVDVNQDTVAALDVETTATPSFAGYVTNAFHQAERNLRLHCFSGTGGEARQVAADVRRAISARFAAVPVRDDDRRRHAQRLIALGTALHCQQDAYAHVQFGGSCDSYAGSCLGHAYETFLDQFAFGVLKKHHFNPDHPAVSGAWLLKALEGTATELSARVPSNSAHSIPVGQVVALSDALRASGLDLPDDVRRDCNRYIAGKWLFDFLHSGGRTRNGADALEKLSPAVARHCGNASLASATIVRVPEPLFPRLNPDASPYLVRADGTYPSIRDEGFDVSVPVVHAGHNTAAKVRLTHWSQLLALAVFNSLPPSAH